jgi:sugar phosphate isomerase/epimerase
VKLSCLPVSLFADIASRRLSVIEWARQGAQIGLDGVDVSLLFFESHAPAYLGKVKKGLEEAGIPLVMATTYPDFTHPDAAQRRREAVYLQGDIALCAQLGIRYLRVLAGQAHPATGRRDGVAWAVDGLTAAAESARENGVGLLYENHSKPGAWDYYDFSYPFDIFLEVCEGIRSTDIRLNFDTANVVALGLDPLEVLPPLVDRVETIHVSDTAVAGDFKPVLVGTGVVPFGKIFHYLKTRGFDKWLCIEEASFTGLDGIRKAATFTRTAWETA